MTREIPQKPLMAEMLVRHVLGNTSAFYSACLNSGMTIEEGVRCALDTFIQRHAGGRALSPAKTLLCPSMLNRPDATDCPTGQEGEWIEICEHDLEILRSAARYYQQNGDMINARRSMLAIEGYIQAIASLKERTECG